ncbi:4-amino-4-deoxy-L-arabinose transferase-like glycosyltransferase [Friedmanniella endophytica]|uniref:4-amino-4-deoxy-L-arabinose transferase-like glycosyltransferase n=1 Tax=Microlunatus kandeliicorticis TaxID=1759536 RepID=A0A7W3P449_9ACTN|nr:DUF2079 domain-containing protein [Microlunatus kandeliicorticis]MBA8792493.1 4-amino-4-deoxy-L-arabinose transferase-like glycosyltransferase [Microlunatus kandeliicorticis]
MTQTIEDRVLEFDRTKDRPRAEQHEDSPAVSPGPTGPDLRTGRHGLSVFLRSRRRSMIWFAPLAVLAAIVNFVNMTGSPQRIDDEGTYTAQAYAVDHLGSLTHYTYWYDHPPLGWIQIAGWVGLTGGFGRYTSSVMAGREFMIVCALVSCALLWMVARRLELSRPTAAAAVAIFALSPLAVQFHRTVFLDNVATPWLLAAFVLVMAPRRQLLAFAAAALCFAVAVLSKETYLLFGPFLVWQMWRGAHRGTRRYTVSLAGGVLVLLGLSYVLLSTIKGELFPGPRRVSLMTGIYFQLSGRTASGSLFDATSQARVTTAQWLQLDPVIAVVAPIAALLALRSRKLWPVAGTLIFLLLFMLRPGYLPVPYVIGMLPFAALLIPAAVEVWLRRARSLVSAVRRRLAIMAVAIITTAAVAVTAAAWGPQLRGLLLSDLDQPMVQAENWVEANVGRNYRVVVDDSMWTDLVRHGFPRDNVVWYYKVDTDPAVEALAPNGWRDYDYVVSTNSMRTFPDGSPTVAEALRNSTEVATFGTGDKAVTIFRIHPEGAAEVGRIAAREAAGREAVGTALAQNPALSMPTPMRNLMTGGRVDPRILLTLPGATSVGRLTVADAPAVDGEVTEAAPRRQVLISAIDGQPISKTPANAAALEAFYDQEKPPFRPEAISRTPEGLLITYDIEMPTGLVSATT